MYHTDHGETGPAQIPSMRVSIAAWAPALLLAACRPGSPCRSAQFHRLREFSQPYAGTWVVAHGDTITFPQMGDRFRLVAFTLDSDTVAVAHDCVFRGSLTFAVPKAETLAVTWFGVPERVTVFGWPADMEPISGFDARWWGGRDSLRGELLFNERVGIQVRPGVTAQFVAGRRRDEARAPAR
jgi:hypothetical protein